MVYDGFDSHHGYHIQYFRLEITMRYENEIIEELWPCMVTRTNPIALYVTGPMYSGKTTVLSNVINRLVEKRQQSYFQQHIIVCDIFFFFFSKRELQAICPPREGLEYINFLPSLEKLDGKKPTLVVFDETHLFGVIGQKDKFIDCVQQLLDSGISVLAAGLWTDCYNDYQIFGVVRDYTLFASHIYVLPSFKPCHICGNTRQVVASVNTECKDTTIGDHYENICFDCQKRRRCVNMKPSVGDVSTPKTC